MEKKLTKTAEKNCTLRTRDEEDRKRGKRRYGKAPWCMAVGGLVTVLSWLGV